LAHGLDRPVWLCDVAALLEAGPLDWCYLDAGDAARTDAVHVALGLARRLLDARGALSPAAARRADALPRWIEPATLAEWGVTRPRRQPIASYRRRPLALPAALWHRWPNAMEATMGRRAAFDERPRLPLQLGECVARTARFLCDRARRSR
jgi:hypothetical protein